MVNPSLVTHVRHKDMKWEPLKTERGDFRITRPFTSRESPTIGGGLVELQDGEMPWTPNYDEIVIVLQGEMSIVHDGQEHIGCAGDMYLIRYGADIVYKTKTRATFAWVLYPAHWKDLRWPE